MNILLPKTINDEQYVVHILKDTRILPRVINNSESTINFKDFNTLLASEQKARENIVLQYKNDIINVIRNDYFEAGIISQSENYILNIANTNNYEYIRDAANNLYLEYYNDSHILTGLLIMMGTLSYEDALPQGQTMALGLLQHKEISVRDRAVQVFERWNSKKGLDVLKELHCDQEWLQDYVNKVIKYLEKSGKE